MQINFFLLIAQILNFLILVYLLKRFLYSRIIHAMDGREKQIASRLAEAERKQQDAAKEQESYRQMIKRIEDERQEVLARAKEEAEKLRQELLGKARAEVEASKSKWYEAIEHEKEDFLLDLRQRASQQVLEISRQALRDMANEELEQHIIATFIKRLQQMPKSEKEPIREVSEKTGRGITVKSAFAISRDARKHIEEALRRETGDTASIEFQVTPDLISGIEVSFQGVKISWSLKSYLDALEEQLSGVVVRKPTEPAAKEVL